MSTEHARLSAPVEPLVMQCAQCQTKLESACGEGDTMQPYGGCEVQIIAAYGSAKFDDCLLGRKFRGVICDNCLEKILPRLHAHNEDSRLLSDCGNFSRTRESTRECKCDACTLWWCANVEGYFYCPSCRSARTPLGDQYDGVCEQCFDERDG